MKKREITLSFNKKWGIRHFSLRVSSQTLEESDEYDKTNSNWVGGVHLSRIVYNSGDQLNLQWRF